MEDSVGHLTNCDTASSKTIAESTTTVKNTQEKYPTHCRWFEIDKYCRYGISCDYLHPHHSKRGARRFPVK